MAGRSDIEAGRAFIRLFLKDDLTKAIARTLQSAGKSIKAAGDTMKSWGTKGMVAGAALAAPMVLAVRAGAAFEDTLLDIRGSTGATADQMAKIEAAAMGMRGGPASAAQSFLELLKAGMSLEDVLGGAGEVAIAFGKVGRMAAGESAVVLADAMKVFGASADTAANMISSAADASSTDIAGMAQAFSQSSAVAAMANQSIGDVSAALALLANAGIKGGDAGTSLKAMLLALTAPSETSAKALKELGMSTNDFRDSAGKMLPMAQIIGVVNQKLGGLNQAAKDEALRKIFGTDAIRAAAILGKAGPAGFDAMRKSMDEALPVGEKYKTFMGGLTGLYEDAKASVEQLAISVSKALAPSLQTAGKWIRSATDWATKFVAKNQQVVVWIGYLTAGLVVGGAALMGLGIALSTVGSLLVGAATTVSALGSAFGLLLSPAGLLTGAVVAGAIGWMKYTDSGKAAIASLKSAFGPMAGTVTESIRGIVAALKKGDFAGAGAIAAAGFRVAILQGIEGIGALLPAALQPVVDVMRKIGGLMVEGKWSELGKTALAGLSEAFTWAMETVKANWDKWLQDMSDKLHEVIGEVWGWWRDKVQDMTTKVLLPKLGFKDEKQLNTQETEQLKRRVRDLREMLAIRENMLKTKDPRLGYDDKAWNRVEGDAVKLRVELEAAERQLKWRVGTGLGGVANAIPETPQAGGGGQRADTSVADREAARQRQQAAADAAAQRLKDLFGIAETAEQAQENKTAADARIKAEKDKLQALVNATDLEAGVELWKTWLGEAATAAKGIATAKLPIVGGSIAEIAAAAGVPDSIIEAMLGKRLTAPAAGAGGGGMGGEQPAGIETATGKAAPTNLITFSAAAAQAAGQGAAAGGPQERMAQNLFDMRKTLESVGLLQRDMTASNQYVATLFERYLAAFTHA